MGIPHGQNIEIETMFDISGPRKVIAVNFASSEYAALGDTSSANSIVNFTKNFTSKSKKKGKLKKKKFSKIVKTEL